MKKFKFNLEVLIKVRKINEDKEKKRYASFVKDLAKAEDDLTILKQDSVKVYETNETELEKLNGITFVNEAFSFLKSTQVKIKQQKELILKREESLSKQREILLSAVKQRKIIEKHKERKLQVYKSSSRKKETRTIDEIGQTKKKNTE